MEGGAGARVDVVAISGDTGDRRDAVELEDEIGLLGGGGELVVSPGLDGVVEGGVSGVGVEWKVGIIAVVSKEDTMRSADLRRNGCVG